MYGEYLKCFIFFIVTPIKALFIPSSLVYDGLHYNICCMTLVPEVIKEITTEKVNANVLH